MTKPMTAQDFEREWWGLCLNTWHEEEKQLVYAPRMGLQAYYDGPHPPTFDLEGRNVLDVGGGPVSLLLKCINRGPLCAVMDPCRYPRWVVKRYQEAGIEYIPSEAEKVGEWAGWDESWCYNVLQHVQSPHQVAANMRAFTDVQRVFEWINIPAYEGHPHELTAANMTEWFGRGAVSRIADRGAVGRAFYGVFS